MEIFEKDSICDSLLMFIFEWTFPDMNVCTNAANTSDICNKYKEKCGSTQINFQIFFKMLNFDNKLWFHSFHNIFISHFLNTFRNKFSFKAGFIGRDCAGVGLTTVSRPTRYWYLNFCVNRLYFYISHPDKRMKQKLIWIEYQKLKITATCICLETCFMR